MDEDPKSPPAADPTAGPPGPRPPGRPLGRDLGFGAQELPADVAESWDTCSGLEPTEKAWPIPTACSQALGEPDRGATGREAADPGETCSTGSQLLLLAWPPPN